MKCIFCNRESGDSKSVEHVIPESLGNKEMILRKVIVCDQCNNYFARKVEKPVLDLDSFSLVRFSECIPNKKGKIKSSTFLFMGEECPVDWGVDPKTKEPVLLIGVSPENCLKILNKEKIPDIMLYRGSSFSKETNNYDVSRFFGKISIEYVFWLFDSIEELTDKELEGMAKLFSPIIHFVRNGRKDAKPWPYKVMTSIHTSHS